MKKLIRILLPLLSSLLLFSFAACADSLLDKYDMVGNVPSQPDIYIVKKDGLWGFADADGNELLAPLLEKIGDFEGGSAVYYLGNKWGLVSDRGEILFEAACSNEPEFKNGYSVAGIVNPERYTFVWDDDEFCCDYGLIARDGTVVIPIAYESVTPDEKGETALVQVSTLAEASAGLYGYMDMNGNWLVEPVYARAEVFRDGYACVGLADGDEYDSDIRFGMIDREGNAVIPCEYASVEQGDSDLVLVLTEQDTDTFLYGYMDKGGEWVIEPKYESAEVFRGGVAVICRTVLTENADDPFFASEYYLYGLIDETGREVIPCEEDYIFNNGDGTVLVGRLENSVTYRIENGEAVPVQ